MADERLGDWKLRWAIGALLLTMVAFLSNAYIQRLQAQVDNNSTTISDISTKATTLESAQEALKDLPVEVNEIKIKAAVLETTNKEIVRRLDAIDASIRENTASNDRLEKKIDWLINNENKTI